MSQILAELVKLANLIITVTKAIACGNRIEKVLQEEPDMQDGTEKWEQEEVRGKTDVPFIEFDKVSLLYKGNGAESLKDITFSVRKGETIGHHGDRIRKIFLVTCFLVSMMQQKGEVRIKGKDVKQYEMEDLRSRIGVVHKRQFFLKERSRKI